MSTTTTISHDTVSAGVISAGCPHAVCDGLKILKSGGNAADAAVATLMTLCVTKIGNICIGGEAPTIVYQASSRKVSVLNGQGPAPKNPAAIAHLQDAHHSPTPIQWASVPAIIDLCVTLLRDYGSMTFTQVVAPCLFRLDEGLPATYFDSVLRKTLDAATGRIVNPKSPEPPSRDWSADLARTLRTLATCEKSSRGDREQSLSAVSDCFYRGEISDQLAHWYLQTGALLTQEDLATFTTRVEEPVTTDYRGYVVHKCGPWTQGPWMCQALRLLEGFQISDMQDCPGDYYHLLIEVMKLSMADRNAYFGDPCFSDVPIHALLSDDYISLRRGLIKPDRILPASLAGDPVHLKPVLDRTITGHEGLGGTVSCVVCDKAGNVVVMSPSGVASTAGSGGPTGVTHGTRLNDARTSSAHPNSLEPGKRPSVTPSPTLITRDGRPWLSLSVPGGHYQDQLSLQLILSLIDGGHTVATALPPVLIANWGGSPIVKAHVSVQNSAKAQLFKMGHGMAQTRLHFSSLGGSTILDDDNARRYHATGPSSRAV